MNIYILVPVAVEGDGCVGDGRAGTGVGAHQSVNGTTQSTKDWPFVEAVQNENWSLGHHDEVANGQVQNQQVTGSFQFFTPVNCCRIFEVTKEPGNQ